MVLYLIKIGHNKYQLKKFKKQEAEVIIYGKKSLLDLLKSDLSLQQLRDAAGLSGVVSPVIGLPDIHQGFGLPVGGIMATKGLISAGAVGMDINCGVRLLISPLTYSELEFNPQRLHALINQIERLIPIGLGGRYKKRINLDLKKMT